MKGLSFIPVVFAVCGVAIGFGKRIVSLPPFKFVFPPIPVMIVLLGISLAGIIPSTILRAQNSVAYSPTTKFSPLNPPITVVLFPGEESFHAAPAPIKFHLSVFHYNIKLGYGVNQGPVSFGRIVEMMPFPRPDILALLETDTLHMWSGNRDVVEYFSFAMSYASTSYGLSPRMYILYFLSIGLIYRCSKGVSLLTSHGMKITNTQALVPDGKIISPFIQATIDIGFNNTEVYGI